MDSEPISPLRRTTGALSALKVDARGKIWVEQEEGMSDVRGQQTISDALLDVLGPFSSGQLRGPDLRRPRPHLRIIPGKCAGEPHLYGSRITTLSVAALADRGYPEDHIARLYPESDPDAVVEAIDLERQLANNVERVA